MTGHAYRHNIKNVFFGVTFVVMVMPGLIPAFDAALSACLRHAPFTDFSPNSNASPLNLWSQAHSSAPLGGFAFRCLRPSLPSCRVEGLCLRRLHVNNVQLFVAFPAFAGVPISCCAVPRELGNRLGELAAITAFGYKAMSHGGNLPQRFALGSGSSEAWQLRSARIVTSARRRVQWQD